MALHEANERMVMLQDWRGVPASVPESAAEAWIKRQAELKSRAEAGEPMRTPEEEERAQKFLTGVLEWRDKFLKEYAEQEAREKAQIGKTEE